jgi:hypothetical protein
MKIKEDGSNTVVTNRPTRALRKTGRFVLTRGIFTKNIVVNKTKKVSLKIHKFQFKNAIIEKKISIVYF